MRLSSFWWSRRCRVAWSGKAIALGVGDHDRHGLDEALGVAVSGHDTLALEAGDQAVEGGRLALGRLDGPGLGLVLVDAEDHQAVGQLGVDVGGRGGEHEGDRSGHLVAAGAELAGGGVLAGRGDREATFGHQQLERVRSPGGSLLFGHRQHLVGQIGRTRRSRGPGRSPPSRRPGPPRAPGRRPRRPSVDLPAAEEDCTTTPKGRSALREMVAR